MLPEKTVLVLGEDKDMGWLLKKLLRDLPCQVTFSRSVQSAQKRIKRQLPQLILLDIQVGTTLEKTPLPFIQEVAPQVPIIVISPSGSNQLGKQKNRYRVIEKPFGINNLMSMVKDALKGT